MNIGRFACQESKRSSSSSCRYEKKQAHNLKNTFEIKKRFEILAAAADPDDIDPESLVIRFDLKSILFGRLTMAMNSKWVKIRARVKQHFQFELPADIGMFSDVWCCFASLFQFHSQLTIVFQFHPQLCLVSTMRRLRLLRRIAAKLGVQLKARSYKVI